MRNIRFRLNPQPCGQPAPSSKRGFSLVEVVVAVGIFALAIVGVIGLLIPTSKNINDVRDADDSTRVVAAIQAQLQAMAETTAGWTLLTTGTSSVDRLLRLSAEVQTDDANTKFDSGATAYTLFASRDGSRVGLYSPASPNQNLWQGTTPSGSNSTNFDGLKFFEITLIRNGDAATGLSPTSNDGTAGFLAYTIRLRWPAYLSDGTHFGKLATVPVTYNNSQKSVLIIPAAVHR